jgi:hypothetical protein
MNISARKDRPINVTSETMKTSMMRMPLFSSSKISSVSKPEISTPQSTGRPKSRLRPMAMPITSARSHAAMAISAST